uniref:Protein CutA n=1 Tax=Globodera pallida TaxID=36090 RepID=A0A183CMS5_GLOPA
MVVVPIKVVYVTVPSMEIGKRIAHALVRSRLAACVNIVPQLTSIYEWKGKVQEDAESMLIIKTGQERLEQLRELVMKLHPYEVPEFVALPVEYGSEPYLRWVSDQISGSEGLIPEVEEAQKQKKDGKKEDE